MFAARYFVMPLIQALIFRHGDRTSVGLYPNDSNKKFHPLMKNLTRWTGTEINSIEKIFHLYHTLIAEHSMGLVLLDWAYSIIPHGHIMWEAAVFHYHMRSYNSKLRRLNGVLNTDNFRGSSVILKIVTQKAISSFLLIKTCPFVMTLVFKIVEFADINTNTGAIELSQSYEVVFISVVFRHGDRTPDKLYPNDPNKIDDFYPTGLGELTPTGKARSYELGTQLHQHYKDLLGERYVPHTVKARSTDINRTKMSLKLVLSALYPSGHEKTFDSILEQQSIPFNYVAIKNDFLLALISCPLYNEELKRVENSDEVIAQVRKFGSLMENLTQWTGTRISSSSHVLNLYNTLMAEFSMGLKLPEWTKNIFPTGPLLDVTILRLIILNYNTKLRKLFNGCLLKIIIESMNGIANRTIKDGRKIQLFSAHDINVASLLITLGIFEPHLPEYTSAVIVFEAL
ncbi:hypothetical protein PV327_000776 [Microctonus hyperodae]|uniref:acid phosphatase n=1 Tax=Microctonus hyperodae TaxID=165561 RepID=A0AA39L2A4_MICHY|nr:hypothetical protein PV327_000776 [Microctonus hyperodae]